jgi:Cu-Zn family superoxide dismutase
MKKHFLFLGLVFSIGMMGCAGLSKTKEGRATEAVAALNPTQGSVVRGTVTFKEVPAGVQIIGDIEGLTPGKHGFHVHEIGDCSAPDASSAGAHFNPTAMPHAAPTQAQRHIGDLGNVLANENGRVHLDYIDPVLRLSGENSIIGKSVIVHAQEDDLKTQPTGNAGGRVACGVIETVQP